MQMREGGCRNRGSQRSHGPQHAHSGKASGGFVIPSGHDGGLQIRVSPPKKRFPLTNILLKINLKETLTLKNWGTTGKNLHFLAARKEAEGVGNHGSRGNNLSISCPFSGWPGSSPPKRPPRQAEGATTCHRDRAAEFTANIFLAKVEYKIA